MAANEATAAEAAAASTTPDPATPLRDTKQKTLTPAGSPGGSSGRAVSFIEEPDEEVQYTQSKVERSDTDSTAGTPDQMGSSPSGPHWKLRRSKSFGGEREEDDMDPEAEQSYMIRKACVLFVVIILLPMICRSFYLPPSLRCASLILSMLLINLNKVMPLFCTALATPVLGTLCSVLGDSRSVKETSTLLIQTVFTTNSFLVLGALVINGIFTKCGLDKRFMRMLLRAFSLEGPVFLLCLMIGGALLCSVLYSGSLVLIAALRTVMSVRVRNRTLPPNAAKRILLGAAFSANAGAIILPVSGVINLMTVSMVTDFGYKIDIKAWVEICFPCAMTVMFLSWLSLLVIYPVEEVSAEMIAASEQTCAEAEEEIVELTDWHMVFMGVGVFAVLGITIYATDLEPIIGHSACLSLAVVVIVFGSGFMSRDEFCNLDWDILALVGGTNVVAFLVRETGLGVEMAQLVVKAGVINMFPYHGILAVMVVTVQVMATSLMHGITGVMVMPLVVAVGIKLQAVETTAILCAAAVSMGMAFSYSSFDNQLATQTSMQLGRRSARLTDRDWYVAGGWTSVFGGSTLLTVGYYQALRHFDLPPPVWVVENMTPEELLPRVIKENIPGGHHLGMDALSLRALPEKQLQPFGGVLAQLTAAHPRRRALRRREGGSLDVVAPPAVEGGNRTK